MTGGTRKRLLRCALAIVLGVAAVLLAGSLLLFTGSQVSCEDLGEEVTPQLLCRFDVAAPRQAVWDALTRTGEPHPYYFDAVLEAEMLPGGRWRFLTDDRERLLADGTVVELAPPRRLQQTFRAADLDDAPSRVTIELEETAGGTRVLLLHDRFERRTETYRRFRRAHPLALSALKSLLETGELPLRARIYTLIFKPGMKTFTVRARPRK